MIQEPGGERERGRDVQNPVCLWLTIPRQDQGVLRQRKLIQEYWAVKKLK